MGYHPGHAPEVIPFRPGGQQSMDVGELTVAREDAAQFPGGPIEEPQCLATVPADKERLDAPRVRVTEDGPEADSLGVVQRSAADE